MLCGKVHRKLETGGISLTTEIGGEPPRRKEGTALCGDMERGVWRTEPPGPWADCASVLVDAEPMQKIRCVLPLPLHRGGTFNRVCLTCIRIRLEVRSGVEREADRALDGTGARLCVRWQAVRGQLVAWGM